MISDARIAVFQINHAAAGKAVLFQAPLHGDVVFMGIDTNIGTPVPAEVQAGVKNPTCSETGLKEACCTVCSTKCDSKIIPVKSHTLETIISKLPTYKETGEKLTKCSACGHIQKTVSIPKTSADINGDKSVTSKDALLILQHATGLKMLKGTSLANADLHGSGTVFSDDALLVLQLATGLITA